MRIVVLGGLGDMGRHVVQDLLEHSDTFVTVADRRSSNPSGPVAELGPRTQLVAVDARDESALVEVMRDAAAAVGCVGPFFEFGARMVRAAIRAGTPYVDICDDWGPVDEIHGMDSWARAQGVPIVNGLGWTPGITNLLAVKAAAELDQVDRVHISWAGSSADSTGFAVVLHVAYAITGKVPTYLDGRRRWVRARSGREVVQFPAPVGAVQVSHCGHPEPLTLPSRLKARTVTLKGGLLPEWNDRLAGVLASAGLFANPIRMRRTGQVVHRLEGLLRAGGVPASAARVDVSGWRDGDPVTRSYAVVDRMGRLTGVPAAIGALMLARGEVATPGVHAPEDVVEPASFFEALAGRGITVVTV